jgi:hypothetical protein
MNCDIENLLFANWERWVAGGLNAASIEQHMDDSDRAEIIKWFHRAFDEFGLPRLPSSLKVIIDVASWCLFRRDSLLLYPPEIRNKSIVAAAKHGFDIPPDVLRFLIQTCDNLLSSETGNRECNGADCLF